MAKKTDGVPDPKRVRIGRLNQRKRKGITPEGRQRLRETALRNRPWEHSTGPRTPEGKSRASQNGKYRQKDEMSRREVQLELCELNALLIGMATSRRTVIGGE